MRNLAEAGTALARVFLWPGDVTCSLIGLEGDDKRELVRTLVNSLFGFFSGCLWPLRSPNRSIMITRQLCERRLQTKRGRLDPEILRLQNEIGKRIAVEFAHEGRQRALEQQRGVIRHWLSSAPKHSTNAKSGSVARNTSLSPIFCGGLPSVRPPDRPRTGFRNPDRVN